ncbi:hypothetical protein ACE3MZ_19105 [Paenibacillus sp. WLX1005]|uniref:hypothetical protein n=1 Tax=unclassified Paenibacillus TaxID=185978 RepID=UPI0039845C5F
MNAIQSATEVRANFGQYIDDVVRVKPQFVKRNRDIIASFSIEQLKLIFAAYEFTFEYEQTNDTFVGSIEQIEDIIAEANTLEELKLSLATQLFEYAEEYFEYFEQYQNAPNRKKHVPYIMRVLVYNSPEEIVNLLHG